MQDAASRVMVFGGYLATYSKTAQAVEPEAGGKEERWLQRESRESLREDDKVSRVADHDP